MAVYTVAAGGGAWSNPTTYTGGVGAAPTAADDVVCNATSGALTVSGASNFCRSLDFTGYTGTFTLSAAATLNIGDGSGGALTCSAGMTFTVGNVTTSILAFKATSTNGGAGWPITTAGKTIPTVVFNGVGGKWTLQDNLISNASSNTFTLTAGTVDTNNKNVTYGQFFFTGTTTKVLTPGSSTFTMVLSGGQWTADSLSGSLTVTANTALLTITLTASISTDAVNWNGLSVSVSSTGTFSVAGAGIATFKDFTRIFTGASAGQATCTFALGITCTGTFTVKGKTAPLRCIVGISTGTSTAPVTITAATVVSEYTDWRYVIAAGAANWNLSGIVGGAGNAGGNTGITFTTPVTVYGVAAGNWSTTATWATSSGGAAGAAIPLPHDSVVLDAASGAGTYVCDMARLGGPLNCTGFTGTLQISTSNTIIMGSITLGTGMTFTQSQVILMGAAGTITCNGKSFGNTLTADALGGTIFLGDNFISTATFSHTGGIFDSAGFNMSLATFTFANVVAKPREIYMHSSVVSITTATGGVSINAGGMTVGDFANASFVWTVASGNGHSCTMPNNVQVGTIDYSLAGETGSLLLTVLSTGTVKLSTLIVGDSRTVKLSTGATYIIGTFNVNGTSGHSTVMNLSSGTTNAILRFLNNTPVITQYLALDHITAQVATLFVTPGTDNGNNVNVVFGTSFSASGFDGHSTFVGDFSTGGPAPIAFTGVFAGVSSLAANLGLIKLLAAKADGASGFAANLTLKEMLAARFDGVSGFNAGIALLLNLGISRFDGMSGFVAAMKVNRALAAAFAGQSGFSTGGLSIKNAGSTPKHMALMMDD